MSPGNDSIVSSPKGPVAQTRIHEGRVEKIRTRKGDSKPPNYSIDGRTFACQSCKKGHRVSKCTHALERPVHMTNDPGRPSADQKRHCDCPKQCSCTKKNCKCARNCVCIQTMYILVHVPFEKQASTTKLSSGNWQIGRTVTTDLQGNQLTDEEIKERAKLKSLQKNEMDGSKVESPNGSTSKFPNPNLPSAVANRLSASEEDVPPSCCQHKKAMEETAALCRDSEIKPSITTDHPRCNCGPTCSCAFCLDHPDNSTSQRIAKEQAAHFVQQGFTGGMANWQSYSDPHLSFPDISCMGTNPKFAMHSQPNPSPAELQGLFGGSGLAEKGYYLSYPIIGPSWSADFNSTPILPKPLEIHLGSGPTTFATGNTPVIDTIRPDFENHHSFMSNRTQFEPYLSLPPRQLPSFGPQMPTVPMQIGNASVSVSRVDDGLDNWHDPSFMWTSPDTRGWLTNIFDEQLLQEMPDMHQTIPPKVAGLPFPHDHIDLPQHVESSADIPDRDATDSQLIQAQHQPSNTEQIELNRPCCHSGDTRINPFNLPDSILQM